MIDEFLLYEGFTTKELTHEIDFLRNLVHKQAKKLELAAELLKAKGEDRRFLLEEVEAPNMFI